MKKLLLLFVLITSFQNFAQNNAFTFNGIDQQIGTYTQQAQINFTTGNFTIEAWVKPAAFVTGSNTFEHTILGNDIWDATNNTGYVLRTGGSRKLDFTFGNGNNWYSVVSTNAVFTAGEWTHVAIVRNGTTFTLYADGQQVGQQTFTQNLVQSLGNLRIGENGNGSGRFFNGAMDEVKFWNVARTQAQVQDDLNATDMTTPPTDLKVYYKMNQTTGQDVISETAFDLFAKYLPTVAVNSTIGFFRTYTFIGGFNLNNNWSDTPNWKNGYVPSNVSQQFGDVINMSQSCTYNLSQSLTISTGVTFNNTAPDSVFYMDSPNSAFIVNGVVNNTGFINNARSPSNLNFFNFQISGTFNNMISSSKLYYRRIKINATGVINNYGQLQFSKIELYTSTTPQLQIDIALNGTINNFSSGSLYCTFFNNFGTIINYNYIEIEDIASNAGIISNIGGGSSSNFLTSNDFTNSGTINNGVGSQLNFSRVTSNSGTINNSSKLYYEWISVINTFTNTGTINNLGQNSEFKTNTATSKFVNKGQFNYESLVTNNGVFQNDASGTINATTGSFRQFDNLGTFTNAGTHISGNDFNNSPGTTTTQNGIHKGSGNFGGYLFTNTSTATIAPGNPIGTLGFSNGLTNNGNINIEIGGTTAGNTYDVVNVTGTATLGGVLNVTLFNNYQPTFGTQTYTILTATNRAGTFVTVNLPNLSGTTWAITYNPTTVVITSTTTVLATDNFQFAGFEVNPNPTNDILNLKNSQNIDNVIVFDLLGKEVLTQKINATDSQIDISTLSSGMYLIKVKAGENSKIIKIIKN